MSTNTGSWEDATLEPEEWADPDPGSLSPEAVENEPDDIAAAVVGGDAGMPQEAAEADVLDQRAESGLEDDGEDEDVL